jgi:alkanesulfonate monooxygenase SsuD/methylene tetrahydromethanopterin reductase-like flavin-dependent oxidoreductase (luciferase family)
LPFAAELAALRAASASAEDFANRMPDAWIDALALVGTAERVRSRIAELHSAGAHSSVVIPVGDPLAALESLAAALPR